MLYLLQTQTSVILKVAQELLGRNVDNCPSSRDVWTNRSHPTHMELHINVHAS